MTVDQCIVSYPCVTHQANVEICPKSCVLGQNCLGQFCVAGCVHEVVTSCSSGGLRWGWSLWKADMMPFNFGIHSWSWFMLELGEKSPYFWLFSNCLTVGKQPKVWGYFTKFQHQSTPTMNINVKGHHISFQKWPAPSQNSTWARSYNLLNTVCHTSLSKTVLLQIGTILGKLPHWHGVSH